MLQHANGKAAEDVDQQNQDAGHRVAPHKLGGTVHRAKKVCLFRHLGTPPLGLFLVNQSGIQVGVHGHLFARHGIECKARRHLGNALGALGHHDKVDHHQNRKHNQADGKIAADQKVAKGFNHCAGCARAGVPLEQHHPGRGHVERQPHQGSEQQNCRKSREIQWAQHVGCHHHHHQRDCNIQGKESVEQPRRHGQHHHRQNCHHQNRCRRTLNQALVAVKPVFQGLELRVHGGFLAAITRDSGSSSGGTKGSGGSPGIGPSPRSAALSR